MKTKFLLSLLVAFCALAAGTGHARAVNFSELENTPIQEGGRKKPFYTFATETLQSLSGRATYREGSTRRPAMEVVLEMWVHPDAWQKQPVVLVNYKPLKEKLGLDLTRKLFSLEELSANATLKTEIAAMRAAESASGTGMEKPKPTREQTEVRDIDSRLALLRSVLSGAAFAFVPNPTGTDWLRPEQAPAAYPGSKGESVLSAATDMGRAFHGREDAAFKEASARFSHELAELHPDGYPGAGLMKLETFYGKLHPFRWAWILYALAAIILGLTSISARQLGYKLAWVLVPAGFALQVFGFVARILIGGRGPVTNMYESVVWVAFGTILFAMILEAIYRSRYMFLGATPLAVVALILADTQTTVLKPGIHPLTAVLRDNFWLSTHVTSITLGYAAFMLSLGVGHIILGKVLLRQPVSAALYNYLYRSLQIGVLLLATGTILGGVWANYSWGRFWDWDPKETWALIALLGYLALLHGRIAGWWKGFGLAVGSVLAFQSVLMAWYGVNFVLGVGLHSYGFGVGGFGYVITYVIAELAFVALVIVRRSQGGKGMAEREMVEAEG